MHITNEDLSLSIDLIQDKQDMHISSNTINYRSLWRAVIFQAMIDITNNSKRGEDKIAKKDAKMWLLGNSDDFFHVCTEAGYTTAFVRKQARMRLKGDTLSNTEMRKMRREIKIQEAKERLEYQNIVKKRA